MKRKEKQKLINHAVNEYSKIWERNYKPTYINKKKVKQLLKEYRHSSMCEWSYCCYGLYKNCWQEPYFEGNWDLTQKEVNDIILDIFTSDLLKKCRTENRMFYCEEDGKVHLLIIARDLNSNDYLFAFSKEEV